MIDIHCHILPGIDDGAMDQEESIHMAEIALSDGISCAIATPHVLGPSPRMDEIRQEVDRLNGMISKQGLDFRIFPGAEVNFYAELPDMAQYCLNETKYLLFELPFDHIPSAAGERISMLCSHGIHPILAHPERNLAVVMEPDKLRELAGTNVLVQISAGSLTGLFGPDVQRCAMYLVGQGLVDFLATDAHSASHRPPLMSKASKIAARIAGRDAARRMVYDNATQIVAQCSADGKHPG